MNNLKEINFNTVKSKLPKRPADAHKGTFGTAALITGSVKLAGAAVLSAKAAIRTGVGIAKLVVPQSIYNITSVSVPEAVFDFLPQDNGKINGLDSAFLTALKTSILGANAVLFGCGIGCTNETRAAAEKVIKTVKVPLVLDADGINAVAPNIELIKQCEAKCIITPHPKEAARLLNCSTEDITNNRSEAALELARKSGACAILKGSGSLVATKEGELYICSAGNPGMATAGSGDVLSGIITALLAEGLTPNDAAICGVYIHAAAGDIAAEVMSETSMCASDIIASLPALFKKFEG